MHIFVKAFGLWDVIGSKSHNRAEPLPQVVIDG